ncbi:hypothetical protein BAY61_22965 [Prauserella marina]|uniref:Uncharacterized protein n=1 Tax=Prauserella marina TaxID=530584 RepID=A0A222VU05_9PSEU|nr:hypothetical protein [Prauserella marina]ASR37388.1 hypothetical protein BAY61_22965 [Prauserella marina]PWV74739.1 hypothetical protein DES30_107137 [Prauserella marina]SDD41966.1 hypothetical protein SAMN05421630_108114 [Prauserella marina]
MQAPRRDRPVLVAAVSDSSFFLDTVESALAALGRQVRVGGAAVTPSPPGDSWPDVCHELTESASAFLDDNLSPETGIEVIEAPRLEELEARLARVVPPPEEAREEGRRPWTSGPTVLFLVEATRTVRGADPEERLDRVQEVVRGIRDRLGVSVSPYSVVVYDKLGVDRVYARTVGNARETPAEQWVLAAETICSFTDLVQARHVNPKAMVTESDPPATMAAALTGFLTAQAGTAWALHFFTGSIVSKLIQDAASIARASGNPVLRGPSEHSLACGALARWQLYDAPYLIVVTAGMVDELRGTLANLRDSQSRGFIVFGETEPGTWQPFQGTVHDHENGKAVLDAYGVPCFHLTDPDRIDEDLASAFAAYHERRGPVVLLASPSVLRHTGGEVHLPAGREVSTPTVDEDTVDTVADILNNQQSVIVCQCGKLDEEERELVYDLAARTGIALVDSLARPGTVARYHRGGIVDEFLGTMSVYGCSTSVWRLLHPDGRLLPYDEHALFFLKSKVPDLSTPFSDKALHDEVRVVQLTDTPGHVSPFTDVAVTERLSSFLRRLSERINPDPHVLRHRAAAAERARRAEGDPLARVPSIPMSHEHFFTRLRSVIGDLVERQGYSYTGFYDVGRGGISAVRNLPRTGPGFSGWYGRALMGDALLAIPTVALSGPENILGFIGDGAARLVPSFLPSLAQQLRFESGRITANVSIFFLLNGAFSIIRSYRELQHAATADAQMSLLSFVEPPWQQVWGGTTIRHEAIRTVDADVLSHALTEPATVNLFSVHLAHDNEGDDIMPRSRSNWRMRTR